MKQPKTATPHGAPILEADTGTPRASYPTLHARILDSLREDILSGALIEGTALRQDQLASRYGASRIPVREALLQLEGEGLVRQQANRGYTVSKLSLAEISEEFDLRAMLESDLIMRAIPLMKRQHLSDAREVLDRLEGKGGKIVDAREWGEQNWLFHRTLLEPARRERTLRIIHNLHRSGGRYVRMHMSLTERTKEGADIEHRKLLRACAERDVHEARRVMAEHILLARDELLVVLGNRR
ncbi:GntR family transcriptional regulator [Salipiger bermudensis]|uniref:Transcriptional regulator, GntR family protein n=1 Tax=Salipiger bermudensis (strain DSM 26914 / JCM 13377 / KCTC 12554 / HTCC2601) TaxID=314265 RepID=Q0FUQ0_SALBH|nr:GntR family transcriptional regulator [Salipiger bermudensis]EAU48031.1 transcriptional regulator, GntR family protein [Salipiger bermudensis HTCC2601]